MQEFNNYIQSKEDILEALRRNKRLGVNRSKIPIEIKKQNNYKSYLEWYVFDKLNTSPSGLITNLQMQYSAEEDFRNRRQRNIDYMRGRQFGEVVYDPEAMRYMTQWEYLRRRNIPPLTYNVVSKLVRSLTGQFREINTGNVVKCDSKDDRGHELSNHLTTCVNRIKNNNRAKSKDAMNIKEMFCSGRPVFKVKWGSKNNMSQPDVLFRIVNTAKFTINPGITDYDLDNLHTELEIHDTSLNDIIMNFANGDYERGMQIKQAYFNHQGDEKTQSSYSSQSFDGTEMRNNSFHSQGMGNSSYRYYEIWTLISDYEAITDDPLPVPGEPNRKVHKWRDAEKVRKEINEINRVRLENSKGEVDEKDILIQFHADFVSRFFVIYMTPWGMVLDVRESPYKNGKAPYVFPPPDINGEIWGIVEEILNAQSSLDRQIRQADAIIDNASKGVWLVPDTAVPDTHTQREYLSELKKTDGAVIYKIRDGAEQYMPKQVYANSSNVSGNVQELIQLYSGLVDEISGNFGAAQGKDTGNKTATGYALESQNAGLNIRDILENYLTVLVGRDELILDFILQGYTKQDYSKITGVEIDPKEFGQFEFSIEQSKGTNSPAHRLALEQELMQLVYNQLLPFEVFLDISNNPVMIQAKQKLDEWKKSQATQQQAAQQGTPGSQQPAPVVPEGQRDMVQGHPQASMLKEQPIKQQMPSLPKIK